MLFNSFEFFVFFASFLAIFFATPQRFRGVVLLTASYVFYMGWRPAFALLLLLTTVVDYTTARVMAASERQAVRRGAMIVALTINLGILATLKYSDFVLTNIAGLGGLFSIKIPTVVLDLVLPVGISFYTFQSIGYTLDVYARRIEAERSFLIYAQYVSFFPQLVAGPIERAGHMLHQFKASHFITPDRISTGLWLIGFGLFKKMCIADQVAPFVKAVFSDPKSFNGSYAFLAVLLFTVQIYCDFSGYSTVARGVARIMGFRLMVNFTQPYFSLSLTEFWRRWHISLSSWFRDYLYFPLGGNRVSELRWIFNTMVVFVVSGVWHGASWTFIAWGALHGFGLVVERWAKDHIAPLRVIRHRLGVFGTALGWFWTFTIVFFGWIFFRASSFTKAWAMISAMAHPGRLDYGAFKVAGLASFELLLVGVFIPLLVVVDLLIRHQQGLLMRLRQNLAVNLIGGVGLLYTIAMFGVFGHVDFIYFQF